MKNIRNSLLILVLVLGFSSSFQIQNHIINGFSKGYDALDEVPSTQDNPTDSEWYMTYGRSSSDYAGDIAIDSSDNVYVVGVSTDPITSYQHVNLTKFDSSGALLWDREWQHSKSDIFKAIALDSEGNIYLAGSITKNDDDINFCLMKFDNSGNPLWGHIKEGPFAEQFFDVKVDSHDNVYVIGTRSWGAGLSDIQIYKFDKNNFVIWGAILDYSPTNIGLALAIDTMDNLIVTGYISGEDASWADAFLAKYDGTTGVIQWYKTIDYGGFDGAYSIAIDSSNNIFLAGLTQVGDNMDMFLVKCDSAGNPQWYRTAGKSGFDIYQSIALDSSEDIILMGVVDHPSYPYDVENADLYLEKYSNSGEKLWSRIWGEDTNEIGYGMALDSAGNIFCCGLSGKFIDYSLDMLLVKFIPLTSIVIDDSNPTKDWVYTASHYMWCSGLGTQLDPYVIEDLFLNVGLTENCIEIRNSNRKYFVIRNCEFKYSMIGIKLVNLQFYAPDMELYGKIANNQLLYNTRFGMDIERCSGIEIIGNTINNNVEVGINILSGNTISITSNTIWNNGDNGISLGSFSDSTIDYNSICYNIYLGIEMTSSSYNNLINNVINYNRRGILMRNSQNNDVLQNSLTGNDVGITDLDGYLNFISKNYIYHSGFYGIALENSRICDVIDNYISPGAHIGILLTSCWYIKIESNRISSIRSAIVNEDAYGISVMWSDDVRIKWNTIRNIEGSGIFIYVSSDNEIFSNTITDNKVGIEIESAKSFHNDIYYNTIEYNSNQGILLEDASYNDIVENSISHNGIVGIHLDHSHYNSIHGNSIERNGEDGMRLYHCYGNEIYYNYFRSPGEWYFWVGVGVLLVYSPSNGITSNDFVFFVIAVHTLGCRSNITGNVIQQCQIGILMNNTYQDEIVKNYFSNCTNGIILNNSTENNILNNTFIENLEYAIIVTNESNDNNIYFNNFTDNNEGDVQAYDDSGDNNWSDEEGLGNYWDDYEERYPDAEIVDGTYTEPYDLDGDAGVSDPGAQPPPIEDLVEKILFDVNESLGDLKTLVENNLRGWRKFVCERFVCSAICLITNLIDRYSDEGVVSLAKVYVLKLKIRLIERIARNSEISTLCDEILVQLNELKNLA